MHAPSTFPVRDDFSLHLTSTRRTGKPRDFILAIMPQYTFYTLPPNAKDMTFQQLYVDSLRQLRKLQESHGFTPLVAVRMMPGMFGADEQDVPEPAVLGDMAKLYFGPQFVLSPDNLFTIYPVDVILPISLSRDDNIDFIKHSICSSSTMWNLANNGDLVELADSRSPVLGGFSSEIRYLAWLFHSLPVGGSPDELEPWFNLLGYGDDDGVEVLRLLALITCGLGISAYDWSKTHLIPSVVGFQGYMVPAFIPVWIDLFSHEYDFFLAKSFGYEDDTYTDRFALMARRCGTSEPDIRCLFPAVFRLPPS